MYTTFTTQSKQKTKFYRRAILIYDVYEYINNLAPGSYLRPMKKLYILVIQGSPSSLSMVLRLTFFYVQFTVITEIKTLILLFPISLRVWNLK